ncbi:MAG: SurA N-terminal domain-containing protein [Deltaproteobacteria bacterium]|nr:SurA N-terminal domain-containing protein [Deltaproteobacteria bacterium]
MLESIRKRQKSIVILVAFAAIIIVFVFWGVGPDGMKKTSEMAVAEVNGETISGKEYAAMYKRQVEYYKSIFKGQYNDEMAKTLRLKEKSLDVLVNKRLVLKDAADRGMTVTEAEMQDYIKNVDAFKKDGAFDLATYRRVLDANRLTPAEFEQNVRGDMLYNKIYAAETRDITVTGADIKEAYMTENREFSYDYATINPDKYVARVQVTDEEAKKFMQENVSSFMEPLKLNAFYVKADIGAFEKKVKVDGAEIKEYYEKNIKQFEIPESVAARHILIKTDPTAKDQARDKETARAKAEEILKKAQAGAPFTELAKKNSADLSSARQGGDLGWFQRGQMVKPFEDAAFSLKKGETSGLVETAFGFHIIQVYDKKEPQAAPLKEVEGQIKSLLAKEKAWKTASDMMVALIKPLTDAKTPAELRKAATERGLKGMETGLITEADRSSVISSDEILRGSAFSLRQGEVSRPLQSNQAFYLIKAIERIDPAAQDFAKAAPVIRNALKARKADEQASRAAEELLKKAVEKKDLATVARDAGLKVEQTGPFSMQQGVIKKPGYFVKDKPKFFEATKDAPFYPEVVKVKDGYAVFKLRDVKDANIAGLEKVKAELEKNLLAKKQNDALEKWIKGLREKAKIQIHQDRL